MTDPRVRAPEGAPVPDSESLRRVGIRVETPQRNVNERSVEKYLLGRGMSLILRRALDKKGVPQPLMPFRAPMSRSAGQGHLSSGLTAPREERLEGEMRTGSARSHRAAVKKSAAAARIHRQMVP